MQSTGLPVLQHMELTTCCRQPREACTQPQSPFQTGVGTAEPRTRRGPQSAQNQELLLRGPSCRVSALPGTFFTLFSFYAAQLAHFQEPPLASDSFSSGKQRHARSASSRLGVALGPAMRAMCGIRRDCWHFCFSLSLFPVQLENTSEGGDGITGPQRR